MVVLYDHDREITCNNGKNIHVRRAYNVNIRYQRTSVRESINNLLDLLSKFINDHIEQQYFDVDLGGLSRSLNRRSDQTNVTFPTEIFFHSPHKLYIQTLSSQWSSVTKNGQSNMSL